MNRKAELAIFFISLVVIAAAITGGVFYFKAQKNTGSPALVGTVASSSVPEPVETVNPPQNVETIPTSTIILSAPVPSSTKVAVAATLSLPYTFNAKTATSTYWPKAWGSVSLTNTNLTLIPDPTTHGANSFLNGASAWNNYSINADASSLMGGWFDIVARVTNDQQNFVYCEFGPNGTEIIDRVNTADTQIAYAAASTTDSQGVSENFGMEVYGNDIGCMMGGREVVGTHVTASESATGGIGFVTFGQPATQKGVVVSEMSVTPVSQETIAIPFPLPPVTPAPTPTAGSSSTTRATPPPAPAAAALSLPYSTTTFNTADWIDGWGDFSTPGGTMQLGTDITNTSAGIFLANSNSWKDYKFTAYVQWISGQLFELVARRTDGSNLVECVFSDIDSADTNVSINMVSGGVTSQLSPGATLYTAEAHMLGTGFPVSIQVHGSNVECDVDNQAIYGVPPTDLLTQGGIGFITWDPQQGNSEIKVTKISVTPLQ